jgi:hypothetical protein
VKITLEPLPSIDPSFNRRLPSMALKNLLIDGPLSTEISLNPGEEGEHVVPLVFLAKGVYGFRAVVQELPDRGDGGAGLLNFSPTLKLTVE